MGINFLIISNKRRGLLVLNERGDNIEPIRDRIPIYLVLSQIFAQYWSFFSKNRQTYLKRHQKCVFILFWSPPLAGHPLLSLFSISLLFAKLNPPLTLKLINQMALKIDMVIPFGKCKKVHYNKVHRWFNELTLILDSVKTVSISCDGVSKIFQIFNFLRAPVLP